jgi:nitric oxide reductase subunit B
MRHVVSREGGLDRGLRWALVLTLLAASAVLVYGTIVTDRGQPPIPERVVTPSGAVLFTADDIRDGKQVFQRTDLMDFGSIYGNGAYFGPDWGADYLHRETELLRDGTAQARFGTTFADLPPPAEAGVAAHVVDELRANRYSAATGTLGLTAAQTKAHRTLERHYAGLFLDGDPQLGLPAGVVEDEAEARDLTAFFGWVAWTMSANRPDEPYSYTNEWPYDEAAGNESTRAMWTWAWASLAAALAVALLAWPVYRRWVAPAGHEPATPKEIHELPVTPSQRSVAKWFVLVPPLLLLQGLLGTLLAHSFVERDAFFGFDLSGVLPYNVVHAWHLHVAIAWIAAAWLGIGLYLAPIVGGREPRRQRHLANALWAAVVVVVLGAIVGIWLGVQGYLGWGWYWVGNQGLEYLQLGRIFQIALFGGLLAWAAVLARAFWPGLRARRGWGSLEHLLLYSGIGIATVYGFGLASRPLTGQTMTDYWRWWVVHLWVENFFEFFTVAVTAYAVLTLGLLSRRFVERIVYFELILIVGSGTVGTGHHFYWAGEPALWLSLGAMFSALEVVPLGFLMLRAWKEYRAIRGAGHAFPHRLPFMFFTSAAVWNVVGAGGLGLLINPPIVSYYEHGEFLTLAHGHAAMFGSFGLLAIGLMYMGLRGLVEREWWSDRLGVLALKSFNWAIVLWLALNLLPIGLWQFGDTVANGFWHARSLDFYNQDGVIVLNWLRLPGDVAFLAGGTLLLLDVASKLRHLRRPTVGEGEPVEPPAPLRRRREPVPVKPEGEGYAPAL